MESRARSPREEQDGARAEATGAASPQAAGQKPSLTLRASRFCGLVGQKLKTREVPGREKERESQASSDQINPNMALDWL